MILINIFSKRIIFILISISK